ncbi:hypothetical protein Naga_101680g1, partial [Nannochloropsis gaditana]
FSSFFLPRWQELRDRYTTKTLDTKTSEEYRPPSRPPSPSSLPSSSSASFSSLPDASTYTSDPKPSSFPPSFPSPEIHAPHVPRWTLETRTGGDRIEQGASRADLFHHRHHRHPALAQEPMSFSPPVAPHAHGLQWQRYMHEERVAVGKGGVYGDSFDARMESFEERRRGNGGHGGGEGGREEGREGGREGGRSLSTSVMHASQAYHQSIIDRQDQRRREVFEPRQPHSLYR